MSTQGFAAPVGPCRGCCPAKRLKGALLGLVVPSFARKHEENGRSIQPSIGEWSVEREFIDNRLKTEIFNQAFGVEKGDEIEAQRDAVILAAVKALGNP